MKFSITLLSLLATATIAAPVLTGLAADSIARRDSPDDVFSTTGRSGYNRIADGDDLQNRDEDGEMSTTGRSP